MHALTRILAVGLCALTAVSTVHAQSRLSGAGPSRGTATTAGANPGASTTPNTVRIGSSAGSGTGTTTATPANVPTPNTVRIGSSPGTVTPSTGTGTAATGSFGSTVSPDLPSSGNFGTFGTFGNFGPAANFGAATTVMGAGNTVPGPSQRGGGAGGFSAVDTTGAFMFADANHDGELTRAEARRLSIMTMSFEEMDRNFDQVISRFEYDDSVR
jgi:hypothetical protein